MTSRGATAAVALLLVLTLAACGSASGGTAGGAERATVRVAAASDLKFALDEIVADASSRRPWTSSANARPRRARSGVKSVALARK